jgi:predicted MPP superfamily phosphohydrolase
MFTVAVLIIRKRLIMRSILKAKFRHDSFTGDIVNTDAKEMHPWIETFNRIKKHEYGKYSVLGNHDYGEQNRIKQIIFRL